MEDSGKRDVLVGQRQDPDITSVQSLQVADWREALTSGPWTVYGPKAT